MALLRHINRLKYIDYMIKRKATGDLESFAEKNGLSKRAMTDVLSEMKLLGFPIKFDRSRNTYYYDEAGEMVKQLFLRNGQFLSKDDIAKIGVTNELCFSEITIFKVCNTL